MLRLLSPVGIRLEAEVAAVDPGPVAALVGAPLEEAYEGWVLGLLGPVRQEELRVDVVDDCQGGSQSTADPVLARVSLSRK